MPESKRPIVPKIRGTQIGLSNPEQIDQIKADMLAGRFDYSASRIAGVRDPRGVYYVKVGHHRMVAAFEIFKENRDPSPVLALLSWGNWSDVEKPPVDARPMPARDWWGIFRNWLGR